MASTAVAPKQGARAGDPFSVRLYSWATIAVFLAGLAFATSLDLPGVEASGLELAAWIVLVAIADALRVRLWDEFSFAMSMPIVLAALMILVPWQAGVVAVLGSIDARELRAQIPLARAMFNRAQVGIAVMAAALAFRILDGNESWPELLAPALLAGLVDLAVNTALVAAPVAWLHGSTIAAVVGKALGPEPRQFVLTYLALWLLAPLTVLAYIGAGLSGVALVVAPAAMARFALVQTLRFRDASDEVQVKNRVIASANDQAANERRDERRILAGELHDEVLPALFKVHLMGEVLRKDLEQGRLLDLETDVPELAAATSAAQSAIRRLMNDLRESALGRDGLVPTLELLARQLESSSSARFSLSLHDAGRASPLCQLVAFQVAREAMTNAARYSQSSCIEVELSCDESLRVVIRDSGVGFDAKGVDSTQHLGLELMRERVESIGGSILVDSRIGDGTTIVAVLPTDARHD